MSAMSLAGLFEGHFIMAGFFGWHFCPDQFFSEVYFCRIKAIFLF